MIKVCKVCRSEMPINARICPQCGEKAIWFTQYAMEGVNSTRNFRFDRVSREIGSYRQINEGRVRLIELEQGHHIQPEEMPGMAGALNMILVPRYVGQAFELIDFLQNKNLGTLNLLGQLKNSSTPVFDGLLFNIICENFLQRIGVNRSGDLLTCDYKFLLGSVSTPVPAPLLISFESNRYLILTVNNILYIVDISAFKSESVADKLTLQNIDADEQLLPPVSYYDEFGKPVIFLMSRKGKIFRFVFDNLTDGDQQISNFHQFEFDEVTYPIILENRYLYFLGKKDGKAILSGLNLGTMEPFQRNTGVLWLNNIEIRQFPMHDGTRFVINDAADGRKVVFASHANVTKPITLDKELNADSFFIVDQMLYSLSVEEQQIHRYSCKANAFAPSLPLSMMINQRVSPIKNMIYINGVIAVLTPESVNLYQDTT